MSILALLNRSIAERREKSYENDQPVMLSASHILAHVVAKTS